MMALTSLSNHKVSRLTRHIVFWVFTSVILIEALIFIPSYNQREKELLSQMKNVSVARVAFVMQIVEPGAPDEVSPDEDE